MMGLYSVYDKVAKKYNPPFVAESDEVAKRSFIVALEKTPFKADMQLYKVGCFDEYAKNEVIIYYDRVFICDYPTETEVK